jgi:beta-lactamase regulating signal transducer with metallopeptidase domain
MANKHRKVWKVVSRKVNSGKQTWPKAKSCGHNNISPLLLILWIIMVIYGRVLFFIVFWLFFSFDYSFFFNLVFI